LRKVESLSSNFGDAAILVHDVGEHIHFFFFWLEAHGLAQRPRRASTAGCPEAPLLPPRVGPWGPLGGAGGPCTCAPPPPPARPVSPESACSSAIRVRNCSNSFCCCRSSPVSRASTSRASIEIPSTSRACSHWPVKLSMNAPRTRIIDQPASSAPSGFLRSSPRLASRDEFFIRHR